MLSYRIHKDFSAAVQMRTVTCCANEIVDMEGCDPDNHLNHTSK